jgi:hypothetical protein
MPITDDMPLADYLALLAQISPAAHEGAQAYLQAFQQRCGRPVRPLNCAGPWRTVTVTRC